MAWLNQRRFFILGFVALGGMAMLQCEASSASGGSGSPEGPDANTKPGAGSLCLNEGCGESIAGDCDGGTIIAIFDRLSEPTAAEVDASTDTDDPCVERVDWVVQIPPAPSEANPPPDYETFECPAGYTRIRVRDMCHVLPQAGADAELDDAGDQQHPSDLLPRSRQALVQLPGSRHGILRRCQLASRRQDSPARVEYCGPAALPRHATPDEYWVRWTYGKPDIPEFSTFTFYDYYPDATNGDWSATGDRNDQNCAPKPPASPITVGYDGWFPYNETNS